MDKQQQGATQSPDDGRLVCAKTGLYGISPYDIESSERTSVTVALFQPAEGRPRHLVNVENVEVDFDIDWLFWNWHWPEYICDEDNVMMKVMI